MSYQVLARKWRPQNFEEMVGQEHVLRALINALDSDRLHHAYLFTGTRGVGKTTIARILAKCLNCETGVTSKPCGKCPSCEEVAAGNFLDLIEVDAASRTKVEDTRELLENVQYAPTRARFKVYLIDEVHMLTGHSFNALLKTLEEPPEHVKFLFATTDPQKLPATILSRCLQFNLKRMPVDMICGHLDYLLGQESIPFEASALRLLARAADGSMRDALSLLDQAIAYSASKLTDKAVRDMLGTVSHEPLVGLIESVLAGEGTKLLEQLEVLNSVTPDFAVATDALISLLHQVAVQQIVPNAINEEQSIQQLAKNISKEEVQLFYQIALQGRGDLALSPDPKSGFEMLLLRMMSFRPLRQGMQLSDSSLSSTAEQVDEGAKKKTINTEQSKQASDSLTARKLKKEQAVAQETDKTAKNTFAEVSPWQEFPEYLNQESVAPAKSSHVAKALASTKQGEDINTESNNNKRVEQSSKKNVNNNKLPWHEVVAQLNLVGRTKELIKHCLLQQHENGMISLLLDKDNEHLLADSSQQEIETSLQSFYGKGIRLDLKIAESAFNKDEDKQQETPAKRLHRKTQETQLQAERNIETDPFVRELQSRFGAQIIPGSIRPK